MDSSSHRSRYLLYKDTTFALRYPRRGSSPFEYRGRYVVIDSVIHFNFDFFNPVGPWQAIGYVRDDEMTVAYNQLMRRLDFVDARFVRTLGPS